ncbi:DUF805 domain-containing protein [Ursidibacter arcticus]
MKYFIHSLKNTFNFKIRANRKEHFEFHFYYFTIYILIELVNIYTNIDFILHLAIGILATISKTSLTTRRLHDLGYSGWWQLILLTPLISLVIPIFPKEINFFTYPLCLTFMIFLFFKDGDRETNKYGLPITITQIAKKS